MKMFVMLVSLCLVLWASAIAEAQVSGAQPCDASFRYEHRNMIDYIAKVRSVIGTVIDTNNGSIPTVCIGLFNADHTKLLRFVESDREGKFSIGRISQGKYRLVIKDQQRVFCPATAILEVTRWGRKRELVVHMNVGGVDKCSFCEAK